MDYLNGFWPLIVALGVVVIVAACVVAEYRRRHKTPVAVTATPPVLPVQTPPEPAAAPTELPVLRNEVGGPPSGESAAEGDSLDRVVREELIALLEGRRNTETCKYGRTLGGRYSLRSGAQITVAYSGDSCVIVRMDSKLATRVRRVLVALKKHQVRFCDEDRLPANVKTNPIIEAQARDFTTEGLLPLTKEGLVDLTCELKNAYRVGNI